MARIGINEVKTSLGLTNSYDIINAIRNSGGDNFKQYVPLANADNVAEVGAGILINQTMQNEFITTLVDRIGLVIVRNTLLTNPLKKFKKGMMPLGRTIEEIFVDITTENQYDPEDAEQTLFKRTIPNVKVLFHERNRQSRYDQTIQDESLATAFTSWGAFDNFLSGIINAIYNSAEIDEYKYMKLLIDNYYSKGLFKTVKVVKATTEETTRAFVKKLRATAKKMSLPQGSRDYNSLAVMTRSDMANLHLFIDADLEAELDVDVLARAFNMDKTSFLGNVTVIDGFASEGLEAVLVDEKFFMVYDNLQKMETVRNPKGLYWNYFFHVWQTLSVSRFANAVAFVTGAVPKITQVIIDPAILKLKPEDVHEFVSYIRQTDDVKYDLVWEVKATAGSTKKAGTTMVGNKLTVDVAQTGELLVTATATYDTSKKVVGECIVTIVPK